MIADIVEGMTAVTVATVWMRRWVDCGPNEPADTDEVEIIVPVAKGLPNPEDRLKQFVDLVYPGCFFAGFNIPYADLKSDTPF